MTLAACAGAEPKIVSQTPVSVEVECIGLAGCKSAQAVADTAEAHCQQSGLHAQQGLTFRSDSGSERATFTCVGTATKGQNSAR